MGFIYKRTGYIVYILFTLASICYCQAQQHQSCGVQYQEWSSPGFSEAYEREVTSGQQLLTVVTVPVVFHIIHKGGPENVADTFVYRVFNELNQKYSNSGSYYHASGHDMQIQFCLANEDPGGNLTSGITRDSNAISNMYEYMIANGLNVNSRMDTLVANICEWDPTKYLNIYLLKQVVYVNGAVGGFATLPVFHGDLADGVFLDVDYLNPADASDSTDPYDYRYDIIAHEVGHYLGLWHTFDGNPCVNNNCMVDGDGVCDTPPSSSMTDTCSRNSCTSDTADASANNPFRSISLGGLGDQPDDTYNLMDYALSCATHFTEGQGARMRATLNSTRSSLVTWGACDYTASVNEAGIKNPIRVFPNPFGDLLMINSTAQLQDARISILNMLGVEVFTASLNEKSTEIYLSGLKPGSYIAIISSRENMKYVVKLQKTE